MRKFVAKSMLYALQYGPLACWQQWCLRRRKKRFAQKYRSKNVGICYSRDIEKTLDNKDTILWLTSLPKNNFFVQYASKKCLDKSWIAQQAKNLTNYTFTVFEYHTISCDKQSIPWQQDFLYHTQNYSGHKAIAWNCAPGKESQAPYCFDITVPDVSLSKQKIIPDMRVCWELSRLQCLYILGKAHDQNKNKKYTKTFAYIIQDWHHKNSFLQGINWVCPMEVAIRSINMIWGLAFFGQDKTLKRSFWQSYLKSLEKHMLYLEHTWEKSWRSHNHYLSNLIGYLYLTKLFGKTKKHTWCIQEIENEIDQQILKDNTHFEGSSSYHQLVAELILHAIIVIENKKIIAKLQTKFAAMILFSKNLQINNQHKITIGDDDNGKIVTGIHLSIVNKNNTKLSHYPNFGISILHDKIIHATYRHPTYNRYQPSGHFHQDELSITLVLNNIPILVDPGSYTYTGNPAMRNFFRSKNNHNTLYLQRTKNNTLLYSPKLFDLARHQQSDSALIYQMHNKIIIQNSMPSNIDNNIKASRTLAYHHAKKQVILYDHWTLKPRNKKNTISHEYYGTWNFIFHPKITLEKKDIYTWNIMHENNTLAQLTTACIAIKQDDWFSPYYTKKVSCTKLSADTPISFSKETNDSSEYKTIVSW